MQEKPADILLGLVRRRFRKAQEALTDDDAQRSYELAAAHFAELDALLSNGSYEDTPFDWQ